MRRSRGYAPAAACRCPAACPRPVLACGAELKNTFCLAKDGRAFVSHHIGDLENYETLRAYREGIEHFGRLFDITPEVVAHDLHPEYLSTKYALDRRRCRLVGVQHHHAHIASCLADNGWTGRSSASPSTAPATAPDGTLWGGEFLVADLTGFERAGHLRPVPLPGGAAAIREPWRMAAAYLSGVAGATLERRARRNAARWDDRAGDGARAALNSPPTSSAGRLFDAVAAVLGVRDAVNYEGQAAIELEQRADPHERGRVPGRAPAGRLAVDSRGADLVRAAVAGRTWPGAASPVDRRAVPQRGRPSLSWPVPYACASATGLETVALSGGVFQNLLLLERAVAGLEAGGLRRAGPLTACPPNDGGISLGQAAVASARRAVRR